MQTALRASCFSSFPSADLTVTEFFDVILPSPLSQVILFFLNRNSTPLEF